MKLSSPPLPRRNFPLRPHRNGQWYKSVWNSRAKKTEQFYFGSWHDDPKGERALNDPQFGWLVRKDAIIAGVDNVRVQPISGNDMLLGELMVRFLTHKRGKATAGELSLATLGDYLREIEFFVTFMKPLTPVSTLKPEHFTAYMQHLTEERKLGRMSRRRVRAYVTAFIRHGAKNGWYAMPSTGTDWLAPATDPDAMRQARARAGIKDYSDRILTGAEIDRLLNRASPTFRAIILLGANCALGPADIGRMRWHMIDIPRRRLTFPRIKTGVARRGFLWKKTCTALERLRTLKHNRNRLKSEGDGALVFVTRTGRAFYREREVHAEVEINGVKTMKLKRIEISNSISITFGRMARELGLDGVTYYRLRHSYRTLGKRAKDKEALDLAMGHKSSSVSKVYDHEDISWKRIRRVAKIVHHRLWPSGQQQVKQREEKQRPLKTTLRLANAGVAKREKAA